MDHDIYTYLNDKDPQGIVNSLVWNIKNKGKIPHGVLNTVFYILKGDDFQYIVQQLLSNDDITPEQKEEIKNMSENVVEPNKSFTVDLIKFLLTGSVEEIKKYLINRTNESMKNRKMLNMMLFEYPYLREYFM